MRACAPLMNSQACHSLSLVTVHPRAPRVACIPRRASGRTRSQALTREKDRCGPRLSAIARASFFLGYHAARVGIEALPLQETVELIRAHLIFFRPI